MDNIQPQEAGHLVNDIYPALFKHCLEIELVRMRQVSKRFRHYVKNHYIQLDVSPDRLKEYIVNNQGLSTAKVICKSNQPGRPEWYKWEATPFAEDKLWLFKMCRLEQRMPMKKMLLAAYRHQSEKIMRYLLSKGAKVGADLVEEMAESENVKMDNIIRQLEAYDIASLNSGLTKAFLQGCRFDIAKLMIAKGATNGKIAFNKEFNDAMKGAIKHDRGRKQSWGVHDPFEKTIKACIKSGECDFELYWNGWAYEIVL